MSERGEIVVRVEGARRAFGRVQALAGLDLELRAGTWLAVLGPNGAGKTSLLRAIVGRLSLDAGRVEVLGERVDGRPRARALRRVGLIPQDVAVYDALTVRENLETFAAFHGVARRSIADRAAWALDWTDLAIRADERAGRLSGGMRRRLNIACGVLHDPAVVLLDEPTVGVDAATRDRILAMLDTLRSGGAALVHSSHDLHEIEQIDDRVAIVRGGRVVAEGFARELIAARHTGGREVRMTLDAPLARDALGSGFTVDGVEVHGRIEAIASGLAALLASVEAAGRTVRDLELEGGGLEDVVAAWTEDAR